MCCKHVYGGQINEINWCRTLFSLIKVFYRLNWVTVEWMRKNRLAATWQTFCLENRRKSSQIIYDDICLTSYLFILCRISYNVRPSNKLHGCLKNCIAFWISMLKHESTVRLRQCLQSWINVKFWITQREEQTSKNFIIHQPRLKGLHHDLYKSTSYLSS